MATATKLPGSEPEAEGRQRPGPPAHPFSVGNGSNATRQRRVNRGRTGAAAPGFRSPMPVATPAQNSQPAAGQNPSASAYSGPRLGVPGTQDGPPADTQDRQQLSPMAQQVRDQEIAASRGNAPATSAAASGAANTPLSQPGNSLNLDKDKAAPRSAAAKDGTGIGTRTGLRNEEGNNLFKPEKVASKITMKGLKGIRNKYIALSLLPGLLGLGAGFALLAVISGPLQFVHAAQLLQQFHMNSRLVQADARMMSIGRDLYFIGAGSAERTRMGYLGNKYTDKIEARLNNSGFDASDRSRLGVQRGYVLDPAKVSGGDYDRLRGSSPEELQRFLRTELKIESTIVRGRVVVDTTQPGYGFLKNERMTRLMASVSGYGKVTGAISSRFMGVRSGISWSPIVKLDRKVLNTTEKRFKAWQDKRKTSISQGSGAVKVGAQGRPNADGEVDGQSRGLAGEIEELSNQAGDVADDDGKLVKLREDIRVKVAGLALGFTGVLCILQLIADGIDEANFKNIQQPAKRSGMRTVAIGNQIMANHPNLEGESEQLANEDGLMYSKTEKRGWFDARYVNMELGNGPVGKEIPDYARPVKPIWLSQALDMLPGLRQVCGAFNSTAGFIVLTVLSAVLAPVSGPISAVAAFFLAPYAIDYIINRFTGKEIDPFAAGTDKGNIDTVGLMYAAKDVSSSLGALPVTPRQSAAVRSASRQIDKEVFQQNNLAYRLFSPDDPKSMVAQVVDKQTPDAAVNVSRTATGLLNLGRTFGSMLAKPMFAAVGAAPSTYVDYGVKDIIFTVNEMDNPRYAKHFENSVRVADLLDGPVGAEYVQRAKTCFGVTLEKKPLADADAPGNVTALWGTQYPLDGTTPRDDVIDDPANKCYGADAAGNALPAPTDDNSPTEVAWTDIRMFMFDSQITNTVACFEGDKQACIDIGMEPAAGRPDAAAVARTL